MRYCYALLVTLAVTACSSQAPSVGPSEIGDPIIQQTGSLAQTGIQCSDAAPRWVTQNYSIDHGNLRGEWQSVPNVDTYEVEVKYSRDGGADPVRLLNIIKSNRNEFHYRDSERGGRYYFRVRVKNRCDIAGAWSSTLTIYSGTADNGSFAPPPGNEDPPPPPPDDDDDDDEEPPPPPQPTLWKRSSGYPGSGAGAQNQCEAAGGTFSFGGFGHLHFHCTSVTQPNGPWTAH